MTEPEVETSEIDGASKGKVKKRPPSKAARRRRDAEAAEAERLAEQEAEQLAFQEEAKRLLFVFLKTNAWLSTPAFTLLVAFFKEVAKEWGKVKSVERSRTITHFRELQILAMQKLFDWLELLPPEELDRRIDLVRTSRVGHKYNYAAAFPKGEGGYTDPILTEIMTECFYFATPETQPTVEEFLSRVGFTILAYRKTYECRVRKVNERENGQTSVGVDFVHPTTRESLIGEGYYVVSTPLLEHPQRGSITTMIELFGKIT